MPNQPEHDHHRICDRLRELGWVGRDLPTVTDLLETCDRAGADWREVLALRE
jgi:hypothetical protein